MNRTITPAIASVATSASIPVDKLANPVNIGIAVISSGTLTYSVQYTYDDIQNSAVTPAWFTLSTISGKTASADGQINWPVSAVRLNVTAWTSGQAVMTIMQARACT